jgi:hypothetical protein
VGGAAGAQAAEPEQQHRQPRPADVEPANRRVNLPDRRAHFRPVSLPNVVAGKKVVDQHARIIKQRPGSYDARELRPTPDSNMRLEGFTAGRA